MKFTQIEAVGVEGLMRSSPLFAWLYGPFDVQRASIVIGVVELATATLIALWPWKPRIARGGLLLAIGTYVLTNSFLFTLPGWQTAYGFPFVGDIAQFLLKDLLLLAGALILMLVPPPGLRRSLASFPSLFARPRSMKLGEWCIEGIGFVVRSMRRREGGRFLLGAASPLASWTGDPASTP